MNRKSERKQLKRFIENLPQLSKVLNIKVGDVNSKEIIIEEEDVTLKFFPSNVLKRFIVFRKGEDICSISECHFTKKEYTYLYELVDGFINKDYSKFKDLNNLYKYHKHGNKRPNTRTKNKNQRK